jgi:hypothetical protein
MFTILVVACILAINIAENPDEIRVGKFAKEYNWYNL